MTNKYGPLSICQTGDPYHDTFHRGVEVEGSSRCCKCHHGSACCAAGNTAPSILGKASSTGICHGTSHENGWVSLHLWVKRSYCLHRDPIVHCPAVNWTCLNALYLGWNMYHWKRGEGGGFLIKLQTQTKSPFMSSFVDKRQKGQWEIYRQIAGCTNPFDSIVDFPFSLWTFPQNLVTSSLIFFLNKINELTL